ncbi:MAG: ABC transporter permease [Longimicrobiales bacterium]
MKRVAAGMVRLISIVVPARVRDEWRAEWLGELAHASSEREGDLKVLLRVMGALPDALWLRRRHGSAGMIGSDLSFSLRATTRRPSFSLMVVLTLALGIGAATSIFSVVDGVLLRAPPFRDPARLVEVLTLRPGSTHGSPSVEAETAEVWRGQSSVFEETRAHSGRSVVLAGGAEPLGLRAAVLEPGFLRMLGVQPRLGREFSAEESIPGRNRVLLLGDALWKEAFGADPGVVGRTVRLDGEPYTVIGVLPPTLRMLPGGVVELALPFTPGESGPPRGRVSLVGRLRADVPIDIGQAKLDGLASSLEVERPREGGWRAQLRPLARIRSAQEKTAAIVLSAAVFFLLLISCANAAGLLLVRGAARRHELEIRTALGAGKRALARLLLVESLVLTSAACMLGLGVSYAGMRFLTALIPPDVQRFSYTIVAMNGRVLLFALVISALTGLLFGVGPAMHAVREGSRTRGASRTMTASRRQTRARSALVIGEVALTMMLLVGAGLMTRSFLRLLGVEPGIRAEKLLVMWLTPSPYRHPTKESVSAYKQALVERLRTIPGVLAVTVSNGVPPTAGIMFGMQLEAEGSGGPPAPQPELLPHASVDTAYFSTLGIPILEGRAFGPEHVGTDAAIIDRELARFFWGEANAVGKRFRFDTDSDWMTVVGVAGDVQFMGPDDRTHPFEVYLPSDGFGGMFAIRTSGPPATSMRTVRDAVFAVDPEQPIWEIATAEQRLREPVAEQRFTLVVMNIFAAMALVLAAIGIYGLVSYAVAQRTREIGIRVALGAPGRAILRDVLGGSMLLVALGAATGLASALALSRFLTAVLFRIEPTDPVTMVGAASALGIAAALALAAPATRARRVAPVEALRVDP